MKPNWRLHATFLLKASDIWLAGFSEALESFERLVMAGIFTRQSFSHFQSSWAALMYSSDWKRHAYGSRYDNGNMGGRIGWGGFFINKKDSHVCRALLLSQATSHSASQCLMH